MRSRSIAAPVNLSTIERSPPPRDWTPRSSGSPRQVEDDLMTTGPFEEKAAAWARFYAIEVDSCPGELEYDRALAAAKRLDAAVVRIAAAGGGWHDGDWPF